MIRGSIFVFVFIVALALATKESQRVGGNGQGSQDAASVQVISVPNLPDPSSDSYWNTILSYLGLGQSSSSSTTTTRASTRTTTAASSSEEGSPTPVDATASDTATPSSQTTSADEGVVSTTQLTTLQKAHWCQLPNGTFLPLNYVFTSSNCAIGQCMITKYVRYTPLQCMVTYCIDGSKAIRYAGQCCGQCSSELPGKSCAYQGTTYPHGSVIKSEKNKLQCWCQQGQIECRDYLGSVFDGMDLWGDGTAVYVIIAVVILVVLIGLLLLCGCTIFFYYYYKRNQATLQQAYDQYINNDAGGWQAMNGEEGQDIDGAMAQQKLTELEQGQVESERYLGEQEEVQVGRPGVFMPPPYALYNGAYVSEDQHNTRKDQL